MPAVLRIPAPSLANSFSASRSELQNLQPAFQASSLGTNDDPGLAAWAIVRSAFQACFRTWLVRVTLFVPSSTAEVQTAFFNQTAIRNAAIRSPRKVNE